MSYLNNGCHGELRPGRLLHEQTTQTTDNIDSTVTVRSPSAIGGRDVRASVTRPLDSDTCGSYLDGRAEDDMTVEASGPVADGTRTAMEDIVSPFSTPYSRHKDLGFGSSNRGTPYNELAPSPSPSCNDNGNSDGNKSEGTRVLEDILVRGSGSGVCTSVFTNDAKDLRSSAASHGLSISTCSISECRLAFLKHLFTGECVSHSMHNFAACSVIASGFVTADKQANATISVILSADPHLISTKRLLTIAESLSINQVFQPQDAREKVIETLNKRLQMRPHVPDSHVNPSICKVR
ncbi:hypothetical protein PILCRDRAFT_93784 [Piloderma croceum F 1598]|uniref:Uncharacterized protein n=1 Tax=Piloderma croceum (strain F 1598) TaxID=765440 RepID=A0A0C3EUY6_PILCF|nr:hypothetical protein PILCRDRAFT_93784 [Piloderma croceum F 1598]